MNLKGGYQKMWSDVFVVCLIVVFGVSSIVLAWEKQQEKYHRRHKRWMKEHKKQLKEDK